MSVIESPLSKLIGRAGGCSGKGAILRFFGTCSNGEKFVLGREGTPPKPRVGGDDMVSGSFVSRRPVLKNWLKVRLGGILAFQLVSSRICVMDGLMLELSSTRDDIFLRSWCLFHMRVDELQTETKARERLSDMLR